ncbi:MAG: TonB-dependent receptor [Balneolales bacterium]
MKLATINLNVLKLACLALLLCLTAGMVQAQTVSGLVTDANTGEALPGVNILVQGTTTGTATDVDGRFQMIVPSLESTLIFSYIGYVRQEVGIDGRSVLNVEMSSQQVIGEELVVIGYGTQRRVDVTGSIGSVGNMDFNQGVNNSPEQIMQGKIAGVNITTQSGQPGAKQTITIRGPGTLRTGSGPLYVIDGVAIDNSDTAPEGAGFGMSSSSATNPLAGLNPKDIESIDVLKDASATAIYGSRGSNGVILITTRTGESGASQFSYSSNLSVSSIGNRLDMLSPDEFADFQNSRGAGHLDSGARTNFLDEILRTGVSHDQSLSLSGGTESSTYYASANFSEQEGIIKSSDIERYGGRLRLNQRFLDNRINIGLNLAANRTNTNFTPIGNNPGVSGDMLTAALTLNPTYPTHNSDGSLFVTTDQNMNPLQALEFISNFSEVTRVLGNLEASFELARGLEYRVNVAVDNSDGHQVSEVARHGIFRIENPEGRYVDGRRENSNFQTESTLNYVFGLDDHSFNLLGGFSYQNLTFRGRSFSVNEFSTTEIRAYDNPGIGNRLLIGENRPSGFASQNELQSFFGRANYDYMGRYSLTATLRADGSSRFGDNNKYGYFPSFAAGWQVSEESFMDNVEAVSNLRLRAGWGLSGNQEIPNGITQQLLNVGSGGGSGHELVPGIITPGITFVRTHNPDLQWEVSRQTNIGVDFGFLGDALYGTVDLFRKVSTDILFESSAGVDPIAPTSSFWSNLDMEIVNQGAEMALGFRKNIGRDFRFDINSNLTFLKNEVRDLPVSQILTGSISGQGLSGERVQAILNNQPIGTFYLLEWEGLDADGINIFRDVDGDGNITNADRVNAGSAIPDMTYGISTFFGYRNFDLRANFNGVTGNKIYWNDQNGRFTMPQLIGGNNIARIGYDLTESSSNSAAASTRFLHDGSFFRLNNVTLGYNVNASRYLEFLRELRFSVTGQNLFTVTDYPGFDPEVDTPRSVGGVTASGIDASRYPTARSIIFAINVAF